MRRQTRWYRWVRGGLFWGGSALGGMACAALYSGLRTDSPAQWLVGGAILLLLLVAMRLVWQAPRQERKP